MRRRDVLGAVLDAACLVAIVWMLLPWPYTEAAAQWRAVMLAAQAAAAWFGAAAIWAETRYWRAVAP